MPWPDPSDKRSFRPAKSSHDRRELSPYFRRTTRSRTVTVRAVTPAPTEDDASASELSELATNSGGEDDAQRAGDADGETLHESTAAPDDTIELDSVNDEASQWSHASLIEPDSPAIAEAKLPTDVSRPSDQTARAAFSIATAFTYAISPGDPDDPAPTLDHLTSVDETIAEMLAVASSWS